MGVMSTAMPISKYGEKGVTEAAKYGFTAEDKVPFLPFQAAIGAANRGDTSKIEALGAKYGTANRERPGKPGPSSTEGQVSGSQPPRKKSRPTLITGGRGLSEENTLLTA